MVTFWLKLSKDVNWEELDNKFGVTFCEDNGRSGIPTRLMVALHYLKFTHDLSDMPVLKGWVENPYWQHFSGMKYFEHEFPCDPSSMTRWRQRIGEAGAEFQSIIEAHLVETEPVCSCKANEESKKSNQKAQDLSWPSDKDIQSKYQNPDEEMAALLNMATRIWSQKKKDKNKVYSVHEPYVECISKGKAHKRYEFGSKVSVATTSHGCWFVGALAIHGNPYDGHTLTRTLDQVERVAKKPNRTFETRASDGSKPVKRQRR